MGDTVTRGLAITAESGTFKSVFVHGVLSALEAAGIHAEAYGSASSSTLPTCCAVIGKAREVGLGYWVDAMGYLRESDGNLGQVVLKSIERFGPMLREGLFRPGSPRLVVAASAVTTPEAAETTQGDGARRLGRKLLIAAKKGDRSWVDGNLECHLFDSTRGTGLRRLTVENFDAVAYASTRMLHAWEIPARVDGKPYVDASYTCSCPAVELAELGYTKVVAIGTSPGTLSRDIFSTEKIPDMVNDSRVLTVTPAVDLTDFGVDFTGGADEALEHAYRHGLDVGAEVAATL